MFKKPLQFPQQQAMEPMAAIIRGIVTNLSPVSRPLSVLSSMKNMQRYGQTGAETRPGRSKIGDSVGATRILGLSAFYTASIKKIIAQAGTVVKVYNPATDVWDTMQDSVGDYAATAANFEAVTFNDLLIFTNGTDNVQKFNGTITAVLGGTPPKGKYIATAYQRMFLAGVTSYPHLLYVSDVADAENWSTEDSASIPINDKDGDEIKWMCMFKTKLMIWKRYGFFELHGPELGLTTDNWRIVNVAPIGTANGRTVAEVNGAFFWLSDSEDAKGIVIFEGGRPRLISEPIKDIIERINYAAIATACATTDGEGKYILFVPLDAATSPNYGIVFDTNDGTWWLWENWNPVIFTSYRQTNSEVVVMGDNNGAVYVVGGTTDANVAIASEMIFGPSSLGINTKEKRVRKGYVIASAAAGATLTAATSATETGDYGSAVTLTAGTDITRIKKRLPLNQSNPSGGFVYRLKLVGSGVVKVHEVGLEISPRG